MESKPIILTIGGSDPSGGAGIQADIKTAVKLDVYPCSVVTTITAQNSAGFQSSWELGAEQVRKQLDSVLSDISPDAVKIGMIPTPELVDVVADTLQEYEQSNIVVDPVLSPTLGKGNVPPELIEALAKRLFPMAALVTPNIPEKEKIEKTLGKMLEEMCDAFLLKGGHTEDVECRDILFFKELDFSGSSHPSTAFPSINFNHSSLYGTENLLPAPEEGEEKWKMAEYLHRRFNTTNTHGSGCVLSAAIACFLAKGLHLENAVKKGVKFTSEALNNASMFKLTKGTYGPSLV